LTAKAYIDFGHHPGKDRLPREAALHGTCVITGLYGSAGNTVDIPILDRYKLDPESIHFFSQFQLLITDIFQNFDACQKQFEDYRTIIAAEPLLFTKQVHAAFISEEHYASQ